MATIAVTGATGFVGRVLTRALLEDGHAVRALVRPGWSGAEPAGAQVVRGDVRNAAVVRDLLDGASEAVHLAASFAPDDDAAEIIELGTRNMVQAAGSAGVKKFVYLACLGAESAAHSPFYRAKWKAETLVRFSDVPHLILRPSLILGPGDGFTEPLSALIRALPATPVPRGPAPRVQPIDVRDVVRCIQIGLTSDIPDGRADAGGPMFLTFSQYVDLLSRQLGLLKPKLPLPDRLLATLLPLLPRKSRAVFAETRLEQFRLGVVASPGVVASLFGFEPRSILPEIPAYTAGTPEP
ncbi:MAG: SDR family oxidoreductase [Chloroflexota bacterium]